MHFFTGYFFPVYLMVIFKTFGLKDDLKLLKNILCIDKFSFFSGTINYKLTTY